LKLLEEKRGDIIIKSQSKKYFPKENIFYS